MLQVSLYLHNAASTCENLHPIFSYGQSFLLLKKYMFYYFKSDAIQYVSSVSISTHTQGRTSHMYGLSLFHGIEGDEIQDQKHG